MAVLRFCEDPKARKIPVPESEVTARIPALLDGLQRALLDAALRRREENSYRGVTDYEEFKRIISTTGGFIYSGYCGAEECEAKVKDDTKATDRVIPDESFASDEVPEKCICGGPVEHEVVWARAY